MSLSLDYKIGEISDLAIFEQKRDPVLSVVLSLIKNDMLREKVITEGLITLFRHYHTVDSKYGKNIGSSCRSENNSEIPLVGVLVLIR